MHVRKRAFFCNRYPLAPLLRASCKPCSLADHEIGSMRFHRRHRSHQRTNRAASNSFLPIDEGFEARSLCFFSFLRAASMYVAKHVAPVSTKRMRMLGAELVDMDARVK